MESAQGRSLFDAELALAKTRRNELVSIVELYKALGGGWSPKGLDQAESTPSPVTPGS